VFYTHKPLPGATVGPDASSIGTGLWSDSAGFCLFLTRITVVGPVTSFLVIPVATKVTTMCQIHSLHSPRLATPWVKNEAHSSIGHHCGIEFRAKDFFLQPQMMLNGMHIFPGQWRYSRSSVLVNQVICEPGKPGHLYMSNVRYQQTSTKFQRKIIILLSCPTHYKSCLTPCCARWIWAISAKGDHWPIGLMLCRIMFKSHGHKDLHTLWYTVALTSASGYAGTNLSSWGAGQY
jgi:hypothetical protein